MEKSLETHPVRRPLVWWIHMLYVVLAWVFVLCIAIQVFLAGLSVFIGSSWWTIHIRTGYLFFLLPVLLLPIGLAGRLSRSLVLLNALLIALYVLQWSLVQFSWMLAFPLLGAFHPVNAMLMFLTAVLLAIRAQRWVQAHTQSENKETV